MAPLRLAWTDFPPDDWRRGAVTVGNFDGVHRGHQALVAAARRDALEVGGPAVAVTFDPPPLRVLQPGAGKHPLATLEERCRRLAAAGADRVLVLRGEPALLSLSPEAFFEDVIVRMLGAKSLAEGYNFRFGRNRAGDTGLLRRLCDAADVRFDEVAPVLVRGEAVSSTRVRAAVVAGDVGLAAELLGRPHAVAGPVVGGARRGRTLGFPTANVDPGDVLVPGVGVYAVRATRPDGTTHMGAANVGPNPTFGDDTRKLEVHLLDFAGDLYGEVLRVEFFARLRDTRPFRGADDLVAQLRHDVAAARAALGG